MQYVQSPLLKCSYAQSPWPNVHIAQFQKCILHNCNFGDEMRGRVMSHRRRLLACDSCRTSLQLLHSFLFRSSTEGRVGKVSNSIIRLIYFLSGGLGPGSIVLLKPDRFIYCHGSSYLVEPETHPAPSLGHYLRIYGWGNLEPGWRTAPKSLNAAAMDNYNNFFEDN